MITMIRTFCIVMVLNESEMLCRWSSLRSSFSEDRPTRCTSGVEQQSERYSRAQWLHCVGRTIVVVWCTLRDLDPSGHIDS